MSQHVVYGLVDPRDGELRYVGKSSRGEKRPQWHRTARGRLGRTHRARWLRLLFTTTGRSPCIAILRECASEFEALQQEVILIEMFRALGYALTNETVGGDGTSGRIMPPDEVERMRHRKYTPEQCAAASERAKGRKASPETRAKLSAANRGCKMSRDAVAKTRAANLGRKHTPEACARMRAGRAQSMAAKAAAAREDDSSSIHKNK